MTVDILIIAVTITAAILWLPWWCYPLIVILIGSRQQALIVLMHEAAHRKLFRSPRWNDFVGEVILAWPLFISMFSYRANHCAHHRHMNTGLDPDWVRYLSPEADEQQNWTYNRTRVQVLWPLLKDLIGLGSLAQFKRVVRLAKPRNHDPRRNSAEANRAAELKFGRYPRAAVWGFRLALVIALTLGHAWTAFFLYWIVPALTMLKACTRLRLLAGHFAIFGGEGVRTTLSSPLETFLLAPHQIGYHVEHHLYPAVYFSRLPELHQKLLARGDYDSSLPLRLTRGYQELIADWTRDAEAQRATQQPTQGAVG
jgi:fatty acid desaturase